MKLYYCKIEELQDMAGVSLLPQERQQRMVRYRKTEDQIRCLTAGLLLRMALAEGSFRLEENQHGKPYLPGGVQFNLSHSGEYVILGVSQQEIGVDIERIAPFDDGVAFRCYTEEERKWLYGQRNEEAFYQIWTAKESIMKATGRGFMLPPQSFSVMPICDGKHKICGRNWFLKWQMLPGHAICTACAAEEEVQLIEIHREQLL